MQEWHRPSSPATVSPRSFYKIILVRDHRLRIPEEFAKEHENEFSPSATLSVRTGQIWKVGVEKADKMLWLNDGWKEFVEHNSIHFRFFLVFNYEGNSKFNVLIFDPTGSEIHNPTNTLVGISEEPTCGVQCLTISDKGKNEVDDSAQTLPRALSTFSLENNHVFHECLDHQIVGGRCCDSLLQNLFMFAPEFALRIDKHGICSSSLESQRANPRYLTRSRLMYKRKDQAKIINLEDDVIMSCKGKVNSSDQHPRKDSVFVHLATRGRKRRFSQDNEIKHKQQNPKKLRLLSSEPEIRRTDDNEKQEAEAELLGVSTTSRDFPVWQPITTLEREKANNAHALVVEPKNPSFKIILQQYNVCRSLFVRVPLIFTRQYLQDVPDVVELRVSCGKRWMVSCVPSWNTFYLSSGWSKFVKENRLVEDDECVFEMIQLKDIVLQVHISRAREYARQTNLLA